MNSPVTEEIQLVSTILCEYVAYNIEYFYSFIQQAFTELMRYVANQRYLLYWLAVTLNGSYRFTEHHVVVMAVL